MFYTGDDIQVNLISNESLTGSTVKMYYKRPSSTTGVEATPITVNTATNVVTYNLPSTSNDTPGYWKFWLSVTNSEGLVATSTELVLTVTRH